MRKWKAKGAGKKPANRCKTKKKHVAKSPTCNTRGGEVEANQDKKNRNEQKASGAQKTTLYVVGGTQGVQNDKRG